MYRFLFRPLWLLFHAVVAAAVVGMIALGLWQLDRLDERKTFNRSVIEQSEQDPRPLTDLLADISAGELTPDSAEWLRVTATGTYLPDQILEFNNSQGGRAGDNVLAALLVDGSPITVIVNRGFIPLGFDVPDAPATQVQIVGFVRTSEVRDRGGLTDARTDEPLTEVRRIDLDELALQLPGDVAPVFVQLTASEPPVGAGDPEPVLLPELDNGPHLSYAIQWFIFALCVAIGWVLAVRRSLSHRSNEGPGTTAGSSAPVTDAYRR